jgi:WD40 repeat protein
MKFDRSHWVETAEYGLIAMSLIGSGIAVLTGKGSYLLILLAVTLLLNVINRLRTEQRYRQQGRGIQRQLQQQGQLIAEVSQTRTPSPPTSEATASTKNYRDAIAYLEDDLANFEESLTRVVQYLNQASLSNRLEYIEQVTARLLAQGNLTAQSLEPSPEKPENSPVVIQSLTTRKANLDMPGSHSLSPSVSKSPASPSWRYQARLDAHQSWVSGLAFSLDHRCLASVSWDKTLKLWQPRTGKLMAIAPEDVRGLWAVAFVGNQRVVTGGYDQTLRLWQIQGQGESGLKEQKTLTGHIGSIRGLITTPDQQMLLSGSYDQTLKIWDLEQGEIRQSLRDHSGGIRAIALSPDGQIIATAGGAGCVTLWQWGNSERLGILRGNTLSVEALAITPNRQRIAAGAVNGTIPLWHLDPESFAHDGSHFPTHYLRGHNGQVRALRFCDDCQTLISGGTDGKVVVWDTDAQGAIALLDPPDSTSPVISLALSADEQHLAVGRMDGTIDLWQR